MRPQVGEMFGDLDLWLSENLLEMTDAQFALLQKIQDAQARRLAEALVDLDEFHAN